MAKKLVKSEQPFALGAHATMLSPTAWAIIRGLTFYGFGRVGVETGNAACGKRAGTKSLRNWRYFWAEAARTLFYFKVAVAPHGYDDIASIQLDRKSVMSGQSVTVRVYVDGCRILKTKYKTTAS